jgi:hypothetical protein
MPQVNDDELANILAGRRPQLHEISAQTPQPTLPAFATGELPYQAGPQGFASDTDTRARLAQAFPPSAMPNSFRDEGSQRSPELPSDRREGMRGSLADFGENYLGMTPQQANVVFGASADAGPVSIADLVPGLGTALSAGDVRDAYRQGDYAGAGFSALGALPMIGATGKMLKGTGKVLPAAVAGTAAALAPQDAEAAWLSSIPKGLITKFGDVKQRRPLIDALVDATEARPTSPLKPVDIADLKGSHVIGILGDGSIAGMNIGGQGGRAFQMPVGTTGGPRFAADKMLNPDEIWASKSGAAKTIQDKADLLGREGDPVNLMHWFMGPHSGDSNTMSASMVRELMRDQKFTQAQLDAVNDAVKAKSRTFPGIENITDEWLKSSPGTARGEILKMLDKKPQMVAGFPSAAEIRFGLTEPGLRNAGPGDLGFMIGQARPGSALVRASETASPHPTYNTKIKGDLVGQLEGPVPYPVLFRDWMKTRPAAEQAGKNYGHTARTALTQAPSQYIDDEIVDRVSELFRWRRQEGL